MDIKISNKTLIKNSLMLYIMYFAQILFPLITLPYLTRVLSLNAYGVNVYVNTTMSYVSIIIEFGFMLSATKDIVSAKNNKEEMGHIVGDVILAKLLLALISFFLVVVMILQIDLLRSYYLFTLLAFFATVLNVFLPDFLFRGLEEMEVLTYRFLLCKTVSTILIFVVIKNDADILMIPALNILSSVIAVITTIYCMYKRGIHIKISGINSAVIKLKEGLIYFISNFATTAFGALNTLLIGIFFSASDVAFWGISMQVIGVAQGFYNPIINSVYPNMLASKNIKLILKILTIFMPLIFICTIIGYYYADWIFIIIGGQKYIPASELFRWMLPIMIFSFPGMLLGWPCLGAIGKVKETTASTILAAFVQIALIFILIIGNMFTPVNLAIARWITELSLLGFRSFLCYRFKGEFSSF